MWFTIYGLLILVFLVGVAHCMTVDETNDARVLIPAFGVLTAIAIWICVAMWRLM